MKTKVVSIGLAMLASQMFADTVAWWHLDDLEVGDLADNASAPFVNAVDATVHAGLARETPLVGGAWSTKGVYRTKGAAAFPEGACWYDPVSGNRAENARGVEFRPQESALRAGGPVIVIPAAAELYPSSFTYEFMFKPDPTFSDKSKQYILLDRAGVADGTPNVGLRVYYQYGSAGSTIGMVVFERPVDPIGGTNFLIRSEMTTPVSLAYDNQRWHHAAVTYESAGRKVRFYVNYVLIATTTLTIDPSSQKDLTLGNSSAGWGAFEGCVDEFRISNRALEPSEFLSAIDEDLPQMFPETAVYQRFSPFPDFFGPRLKSDAFDASLLRNLAPADTTLGDPNVKVFGDGYAVCDDVPVGNVSTGQIGTAISAANRTSVALRSSATSRDPFAWSQPTLPKAAPCWNWMDAASAVSTNDVTAELFFRTTNVAYMTYFFMLGRPAWQVAALGNNGGIALNSTTVYDKSMADGKWHHLAFVADGATKRGRIYLDYVQRGDEVPMKEPSAGKTLEEYIAVGCYGKDMSVTFFDIDLDDVRITRRKLTVDQFLHETRPDVIVDLDYDGDDDLRRRWMTQILPVKTKDAATSVRTTDGVQKPSVRVAEGLFGAVVTNASAGAIVGGSGQNGSGCQSMSGAEVAALADTGFTIEFEANFPVDASSDYTGEWAYFFAHKNVGSGLAYMMAFQPATGALNFCLGYTAFATVAKSMWMDGLWHHYALVYDRTASEVRAYMDYGLIAAKSDIAFQAIATNINFGAGAESWGNAFGLHSWRHDNFRITRRALKPCEFKTSRMLSGKTLVWAPFDRNGALFSTIGLAPTFSGSAWCAGAGRLTDASGETLRLNRGAFSAVAGVGAYSRLSLIERPDLTVEFFLSCAGSVAGDADIVGLTGPDGAPIWTVRAASDGKMHVLVTPQGGALTDLGAIADLPTDWKHVAVSFDPAADGLSTTASFYIDHVKAGDAVFSGRLSVSDISTSSLTCGAFAGSVDELRVSLGVLTPAEMLYAHPRGFMLVFR